MTPGEYFDSFVLPAFREYREAEKVLSSAVAAGQNATAAETEARRKAAASAVATWHMADWMWEHFSATDPSMLLGAPSLSAYRDELERRFCDFLRNGNPERDFNLIGAIADAFKHHTLRNTNREIADAEAAAGMSTGWGEMRWSEGKWGGGPQVIITLRDGRKRAYSAILQNSVDMWRRALGISPLPPIGE